MWQRAWQKTVTCPAQELSGSTEELWGGQSRKNRGSQVQQDFLLTVGPWPRHCLSSLSGLIMPQRIKHLISRVQERSQTTGAWQGKQIELRGLPGVPILLDNNNKMEIKNFRWYLQVIHFIPNTVGLRSLGQTRSHIQTLGVSSVIAGSQKALSRMPGTE